MIRSEEQRFGATLEMGIEKFEQMIDAAKKNGVDRLDGKGVFTLYDTYGFPMDLTRLMAEEKQFTVDEAGYRKFMYEQKARARGARKADEGLSPEGWTELGKNSGTEFVGYDEESCTVKIRRYKIVDEGDEKTTLLFILDKTPFYAESGGQVGDRGTVTAGDGREITVVDTIKWNDLAVHKGVLAGAVTDSAMKGSLKASVASALRSATRRNHSATHLLQAALRKVLGDHIQQAGSKVEPDGLRFDFTHFKAMTSEEIATVEKQVNEWVVENFPVQTSIEDLETAKAAGATALFGEKYADEVRVVAIDPVSKELCGGTHVAATGNIGLFHITTETSISAGVRRIEAITGPKAVEFLAGKESTVSRLTQLLKIGEEKLVDKVQGLMDSIKALETQLKTLSTAQSEGVLGSLFEEAANKKGAFPWVVRNLGVLEKDAFSSTADALSDAIKEKQLGGMVVVLGAEVNGKALFAAGAGKDAVGKFNVHCGDLVKTAAKTAGGGGGGSPVRAQAGGKDSSKIDAALEAAAALLAEKTGAS